MQDHTHLGLEELKERMKATKKSKEALASLDETNPNNVHTDDIMVILHKEEVDVLTDLLYTGLEDNSLSSKYKRHMLNIIKHLEV